MSRMLQSIDDAQMFPNFGDLHSQNYASTVSMLNECVKKPADNLGNTINIMLNKFSWNTYIKLTYFTGSSNLKMQFFIALLKRFSYGTVGKVLGVTKK